MADAATGSTFCIDCGYVLEENTMVSDMSFVQTSSGAAAAAGTFVNIGASMYIPLGQFRRTLIVAYSVGETQGSNGSSKWIGVL